MEKLRKVNKECNVAATMTRHRNVFSMVANNVGITFFTKRMLEEGHSIEGLKYVPLAMPIYSNVYIVKRKEKTLNATTEKFWKFLCGKYQEYRNKKPLLSSGFLFIAFENIFANRSKNPW